MFDKDLIANYCLKASEDIGKALEHIESNESFNATINRCDSEMHQLYYELCFEYRSIEKLRQSLLKGEC